MSEKLYSISWLEKQGVSYRLIELPRPPKNAQDITELFGCPLAHVIKTLLFTGDKNVIACIPGDKNVNVFKLCHTVEASELRLASTSEIREITGLEIGGVTPFSDFRSAEIELVLDVACLEPAKINIGAGTRTTGIELATSDLKQIWPGMLRDVSKSRE